ncbi:MAG: hypothetical protein V3T05_02235 [Myxococcota bacterium]
MRRSWKIGILVIITATIGFACGGRKGGKNDDNGSGRTLGSGDSDGLQYCTDGIECRSGICNGGQCEDAATCIDHADCNSSQYCHFPSNWTPGTSGECAGPCGSNAACDAFMQECRDGRCYTNQDCNPDHDSSDCPPGEVCNRQSRVCTAPPTECYFDEQCPAGWLCDTVTEFECYDPNALGECTVDADCNSEPGCETGCECFDGACRTTGGCDPRLDPLSECGAGNYCAGGVCRPATACADQGTCTAYGLLCDDPDGDGTSHCVNPPPCQQPGNTCTDATHTCRQNLNPPVCLPADDCECNQDSTCPTERYCELFTCACQVGCRDNASCIGQCGTPTIPIPCTNDDGCQSGVCGTDGNCSECYCGSDHTCSSTVVVDPGADCNGGQPCPAGTMCVYNDPSDSEITCGLVPIGDCTKSCHVVCDLLVSQLIDPCPAGEACGGDGGLFEQVIMLLFKSLLDTDPTNSNVSACYPTTP